MTGQRYGLFPVLKEIIANFFLLKRKLIFRMNQHIRAVLRVLKHGAEGQVATGDAAILDVGRVSGEQVAVRLDGCARGGVVVDGERACGLRSKVAAL